LTAQPSNPVFSANNPSLNPSSNTLESSAVVITQRLNTRPSSPNTQNDSVVRADSTNQSALFASLSGDFPASPITDSNPQDSNANPTTLPPIPTSNPSNSSANNLPQARASTAEQASHRKLPTEKQLKSLQGFTSEEAADALFASEFIRHESQIQARGYQHDRTQLPADSIHQQLTNLETLLQNLAMSRSLRHPAAKANAAAGARNVETGQVTHHTNHRSPELNPMKLLVPTAPSNSEFAATANLNSAQVRHAGQWVIPLGRHRAITVNILPEATSHEPISNGPSGVNDDLQPTSPLDADSKPMNFTPTARRGFAILCCVMIFPLIGRRYQQRRKPPRQNLQA